MAQSLNTDQGTLIIPGAYPTIKVVQSASGLSTTGVLMLMGEADAGPDFSLESDLSQNSFGPDQLSEVTNKYRSGPIVDAFRGAVAAANDAGLPGSFSRAIVVKTNKSGQASGTMLAYPSGNWGTLNDKSYGKAGNLIYFSITAKQTELVPTTGAFTYLRPIFSTDIDVRVNGGAAQPLTLPVLQTPAAFVSAVNTLSGVGASGGVDRVVLGLILIPGSLTLTVVTGYSVTIDFTGTFAATPQVGDTLVIPSTSVLSVPANAGSYVVTSATNNQIKAIKLLDETGATPDQVTVPVTTGPTPAVATSDITVYSPVTIATVAGDPVNGQGKALELSELTTATGLLSILCYALNNVKVTWVSKAAAPYTLAAGAEYIAQLESNRSVDNIQEQISAGGNVALKLGYKGTTAVAVVATDTVTKVKTITLTVTGGAGVSAGALNLADYPTLGDLASYINTLAGYKAAAGSTSLSVQPASSLDEGTFGFGTTHGTTNGRIKQDAYRWVKAVTDNSVLVAVKTPVPVSGLPKVTSLTYLAGGSKGGTLATDITAAISALELLRGNFLVPLFARDAADDKTDGLTDAASTYTIDAIHAAVRSHCLSMSTLKRRRNRQGFLAYKGTFANAKSKAADMGSFRVAMTFQDVRDLGTSGSIVQFQSWMAAVKAAGMQAAGFYRPIVHKFINVTGALQAAGDFNDQDDSKMEDALLAGLLPIRRAETGGFFWVSDQTTYGKDNNFVFNSIQATYIADVVALTTAQRMENAFVGQSVADVSAATALNVFSSIMLDMRGLKLIAPSDDAPAGYKNASIKISGPSMVVSAEIKLAGAIYFIPITFLVSQVTQTATGP